MTDVLITPGSRKIEFFNSGDSIDATISTDVDGNLSIQNPGGDIAIGDVTGDVFIGDGVNNVDLVFEQDGIIYATSGNTLTIGAGGSSTVITGSGVSITGTVNFDSAHFDDNKKLYFGTSNDLQIYHDGSHSWIDDAGTGVLYIRGNGGVYIQKYTGEQCANFLADGAVNLYHNNSAKFATTSTGVDVSGTITANGLDMDDNHKILLGTGDDLEIYHDGTSNYIKSSSGQDLIINRGGTGSQKVIIATGGSTAGGTTLEFQPIDGFGAAVINNTATNTGTPLQLQIGGTAKLQIDTNDVKVVNSKLNVYGGASGFANWDANSIVRIENGNPAFIETHVPSDAQTGLVFSDNSAQVGGIRYSHNSHALDNTLDLWAYNRIRFKASQATGPDASTTRMTIANDGEIGIGTEDPVVALDISSKTDAIGLPKGTTAERPSSPVQGQFRYNTETPGAEIYDGTSWGAVGGGGGVTAKRTIAYSILYGRL